MIFDILADPESAGCILAFNCRLDARKLEKSLLLSVSTFVQVYILAFCKFVFSLFVCIYNLISLSLAFVVCSKTVVKMEKKRKKQINVIILRIRNCRLICPYPGTLAFIYAVICSGFVEDVKYWIFFFSLWAYCFSNSANNANVVGLLPS